MSFGGDFVDTDFGSGAGQPSDSIRVQGNYTGTDRSGTKDLGNDIDGIFLDGSPFAASNNTIGDGTSGGSNTIASNGDDGIEIESSGTRSRATPSSQTVASA